MENKDEEIDIKYRIYLQGKYWAGINTCPECNHHPDSIVKEIIGFAYTDNGIMAICECPECFTKWYFHARGLYHYFKIYIKFGNQKHFKS